MISNAELTRIAAEFRDRGFGLMPGALEASLVDALRRDIAAIIRRQLAEQGLTAAEENDPGREDIDALYDRL